MTPEETYAALFEIEATYASCVCTKKKNKDGTVKERPLFNSQATVAWEKAKKLVRNGHYGSGPTVPRYQDAGRCEKTKLKMYTCTCSGKYVWAHYSFWPTTAFGHVLTPNLRLIYMTCLGLICWIRYR